MLDAGALADEWQSRLEDYAQVAARQDAILRRGLAEYEARKTSEAGMKRSEVNLTRDWETPSEYATRVMRLGD